MVPPPDTVWCFIRSLLIECALVWRAHNASTSFSSESARTRGGAGAGARGKGVVVLFLLKKP